VATAVLVCTAAATADADADARVRCSTVACRYCRCCVTGNRSAFPVRQSPESCLVVVRTCCHSSYVVKWTDRAPALSFSDQRRQAPRAPDGVISTATTVCHRRRRRFHRSRVSGEVTDTSNMNMIRRRQWRQRAVDLGGLRPHTHTHVQHTLTGRRRRVEGNCIPPRASSRRGPALAGRQT